MHTYNETTAYILWAIGGVFGLHHFYLGRDAQGCVWLATFGVGLIGWVRDFWKIQNYVREANGEMHQTRTGSPSSAAGWSLTFRQILLGWFFAILFRAAIPMEIWLWTHIPYRVVVLAEQWFGSVVGVYLASNIGPYKLPFSPCLDIGTFCLAIGFSGLGAWILITTPAIIAASANKDLVWAEPRVQTRHSTIRLIVWSFVAAICWFAYLAFLYHAVFKNDTAIGPYGKQMTVAKITTEYWTYYRRHGYQRFIDDVVKCVDPKGRYQAHWTIGLCSFWMKPADLKSCCRKLLARWHPDHFHTPAEKAYADRKFKTVKSACDLLRSVV